MRVATLFAFALVTIGASVAKAEDAPAGDAPKAEKKAKKGKKEKKADDKGAEGGDKK